MNKPEFALPPKRFVCMASGTGSIFEHVISLFQTLELPVTCVGLVSDVPDCGAVTIAKNHTVPVYLFPHWKREEREATCQAISDTLETLAPDIVVSLGFMRILSSTFVERWKPINTHPSLLPAFPGQRAPKDAWAAGVYVTGATVHTMVSEVDSGPILVQSACFTLSGETPDAMHARLKTLEKVHVVHTLIHTLYGEQQNG